MTSRIRRARSALTAAFLCVLSLFGAARATAAAEIRIKIDNFVFNPASVTIRPGDVVTWENADAVPHNIVSTAAVTFKSKVMDTDEKVSITFDRAATIEYFCGLHPHMKGQIIVSAEAPTN
jgi:plastocyanin